jgi:hypothetical protein
MFSNDTNRSSKVSEPAISSAPWEKPPMMTSEQEQLVESAIRMRLGEADLPGAEMAQSAYGQRLGEDLQRGKALYAICARYLIDLASSRRYGIAEKSRRKARSGRAGARSKRPGALSFR